MNTVHVNASRSYDVLIGHGLLESLGRRAAMLGRAKTACVVSDSNVFPLYGERAVRSLCDAGLKVCKFVIPAGEASKNGQTFLALLSCLAENRLTRTDLIVALGGGVVGDLAGFAAACYLRGIRFIQIPTTLLAAVDSSVGGKTAINLPAGKNLVGAFYQPSFVLCDIDALNTLPADVFRDGCAEVIKYGVLYDPALFAHLRHHGLQFAREEVVTRCVELKRNVIAEDEFDTGARMKLNLGHTPAHSIEILSGFTVSHGKAVAAGMAMIARAGYRRGFCEKAARDVILEVLTSFALPISCAYSAESLSQCALADKKRTGNTVNLIVPRTIGMCEIVPTPVSELESFFKAGL